MSSGMNTEQAKEYAKTMTYSEAVSNVRYSKGIKYRKATMIKLRELAEIADRLDRKTEPSAQEYEKWLFKEPQTSGKPYKIEASSVCKDEPQTDCETCKHYNPDHEAIACERCFDGKYSRYEPKTEPQTEVETMSCAECKNRPIGAEICEEACHYEPQTDWHYDEQDATWYPYKHEDEPQQKSCATCKHALGNWGGESNNCGRCCGADRRFYEPTDEPQTEEGE